MDVKNGTRFEFDLRDGHEPTRAEYDAMVVRGELTWRGRVEIRADATATITSEHAELDASAATQLVALAKTLGRRADAAPWPRRITRWRQPGVR